MNLADVIEQLERQGLTDIILPFLLVFALVLGLLSAAGPFKDKKQINTIIALVLALYTAVFSPFAAFVQQMVAGAAAVLVLILFFILIGSFVFMARKREDKEAKSFTDFIAEHSSALFALIIITVLLIFASAGGMEMISGYGLNIEDFYGILFLIGIFLFVRWVIGGGKKMTEDNATALARTYLDLDIKFGKAESVAEKIQINKDRKKIEKMFDEAGMSLEEYKAKVYESTA